LLNALAEAINPPEPELPSADEIRPHLKILTKDVQLVPFVPNRAQAHFLEHRTGRDLILKARQLGISTAIQADYFTTAITQTSLQATLAHDNPTTQKLRRMAKRFHKELPDHLRPQRGYDNATTTTYPATNSEVTIATAGGLEVGRGGTYTHVHGSEVAFWDDAEAIMTGLMQGVPTDGMIALESTPNGAQGWFYERCMEALDGDTTWTLHFFPWWHDDGYTLSVEEPLSYDDDEARLVEAHGLTAGQIAWRRAKQKELGRLFAQEYPEDARSCFLLSGESYFGPLEGVFTAEFGASPQPGHRYVAGLDFGQANDYTVLSVIDATTLQQVALLRINKLDWPDIRRRVAAVVREWRVAAVYGEYNSIGGPNISEFQANGLPLFRIDTLRNTKPPMVMNYHAALNEYGVKLLDTPEQRREHQSFTAKQTATGYWKYEAQAPEHDDIVMANVFACWGLFGGGKISVQDAPDILMDRRRY
jgi:hypothetical protein